MEDLTQKITQLLNDPNSVDMVKSLAKSMNLGTSQGDEKSKSNEKSDDFTAGLPINPQQMGMLVKVMNALKSNDSTDDNIKLIMALKPHLSAERRKKADNAAKILKMIKLLPLIKDSGIFEMFE